MQYKITGTPLPVVECTLESGEAMNCENGAMSWMSGNMAMKTTGGGLGKMLGKVFSGESMFHNTYVANGGAGSIAFASSVPGDIIAVDIAPGRELVCQKGAYLASETGVEFSIFFQKKLGAGLFGGEGFILQKLSGSGKAFVEIDGSVTEKTLAAGEKLIIDTGYLAMMDATCSVSIVAVKGVKNVLFGGEGMFNTVVTGPGRVWLQSMPLSQLAGRIVSFIPKSNG